MTTKAETLELIEELQFAYPDGTYAWRGNIERVVDLWHRSLGDLPYSAVSGAIRRWIDTEPKLPHLSDIRGLIAAAINPMQSEGEVYSRRFAYFRSGRGEEERTSDAFAFRVFRDIGSPADCGQMSPDDLREAVTWAYKRIAAGERTERTATVSEALQPAVDVPRLKAVGA